jgi:hypothetical protein
LTNPRYIALAALFAVLVSCSAGTDSHPDSDQRAASVECTEPENPWEGEEGGHDAGFRWAEENGEDCSSDHGQSFEEGCNEYHEQRSRYEACEASKAH